MPVLSQNFIHVRNLVISDPKAPGIIKFSQANEVLRRETGYCTCPLGADVAAAARIPPPRPSALCRGCARAGRSGDLLPNYLSQRLIDPILPARSGFLKVIKNVPVNSQRDKLLGIRDSRTLRREFRGLRGRRLERRFSRIP